MMVICKSLRAGLIISLVKNYLIHNTLIEQCMQDREEESDYEVSYVVAGVSESSCVHHGHV